MSRQTDQVINLAALGLLGYLLYRIWNRPGSVAVESVDTLPAPNMAETVRRRTLGPF